MRSAAEPSREPVGVAQLWRATAISCVLALVAVPTQMFAQAVDIAPEVAENAQMLLEADTLTYDNDLSTVTASGSVRIDYGGNRLVAQRVTYNRATGRLVASGSVEIIDTDGTRYFSDEIDITDDFADGFVNALRVETVDKTYFAAESAERKGGRITSFNNGVYTACAPCEEKPDKAPIWRIKAQKIIWNGETRTVRFERSRFELFGYPIAFLPAFEIADPSVKRKSGFLFPGVAYRSELGYGVSIPYYLALSPTYDLTVVGRGYTRQGFLGEAEWRQRFNNGQYTLKIAGMSQAEPDAFDLNTVNRGTEIDPNRFRGMVGSQGHFTINPRWAFGWDILAQTDKNFAHTYNIEGYQNYLHRSEVYLTGLNDRNYFDLRGMRYQVQEDILDTNPVARNEKQPYILPTLDYAYTPDESIAGGELNIDVNARGVHRNTLDANLLRPAVNGIDGTSARITAEAEWRRSIVTDGGLVVTPLLHVQGDAVYTDASASSVDSVGIMGGVLGVAEDIRSALYRSMATAGLELRWPVLFSTTSSTHILEPMAQVFARPNEAYGTTLTIPNEDAQSFVFDASTLFERDKFSGYDRIEGGSRVNVGFRYAGTFGSGWSSNALFGQSFQLAGRNSFASPDLVNVGAYSGLETDTSDFVGLVGLASPGGFSTSASARLDEQSLELRRAEIKAGYSGQPVSISAKYAFIQAQPLYGFSEDRHEVSVGTSARINENWRLFASGTYDFQSKTLLSDAVGFAYDDECFSYVMTMSESRNRTTNERTQNIGFNVSFRTLGDFGSGTF